MICRLLPYAGKERPDFVLQNMAGAVIDFIIIKGDREASFAIDSRRLAARSQRYFFAHRPNLNAVGARRLAVIGGKYGVGVFCNLPDGTVCMCNYSYQHEDSDFLVGDHVMLIVQRFEMEKKQMYGKILTKW